MRNKLLRRALRKAVRRFNENPRSLKVLLHKNLNAVGHIGKSRRIRLRLWDAAQKLKREEEKSK